MLCCTTGTTEIIPLWDQEGDRKPWENKTPTSELDAVRWGAGTSCRCEWWDVEELMSALSGQQLSPHSALQLTASPTRYHGDAAEQCRLADRHEAELCHTNLRIASVRQRFPQIWRRIFQENLDLYLVKLGIKSSFKLFRLAWPESLRLFVSRQTSIFRACRAF